MKNELPKKFLNKIETNKKALEKMQNLTLDEGKELLSKLPESVACNLYAKNCNNDEIRQLVKEWESVNNISKIKKLKHALKKNHRIVIGI